MDRSGVKRARIGTPENTSKKKDKDKTKKKKKSKPHAKKSDGGEESNPLESTATADGQYMAKILSTFSKMEQSRFEAFKRVSFPFNAISQYVAHCLAEQQQTRRQQHVASNPNPRKMFLAADATPQMHDFVVPGQEEEVATVVATLAKAYAQRLCAAAQTQQQHLQQKQWANRDSGISERNAALNPEHVLRAFFDRKQLGLDPGFFLQPNDGVTMGVHIDTSSKEQMKRVAALAAQENFDRCFDDYKEWIKTNPQNTKKMEETNELESAKKVEIDSDSGDDDEMDLDLDAELG